MSSWRKIFVVPTFSYINSMWVCDSDDIFINVSSLIIVGFFMFFFSRGHYFTLKIFSLVKFSNFHFPIHYLFHQQFIFLAQYSVHESLTFSHNPPCLLLNPFMILSVHLFALSVSWFSLFFSLAVCFVKFTHPFILYSLQLWFLILDSFSLPACLRITLCTLCNTKSFLLVHNSSRKFIFISL